MKAKRLTIERIFDESPYNYVVSATEGGDWEAFCRWLNFKGERQFACENMELSAGYRNPPIDVRGRNQEGDDAYAGIEIWL